MYSIDPFCAYVIIRGRSAKDIRSISGPRVSHQTLNGNAAPFPQANHLPSYLQGTDATRFTCALNRTYEVGFSMYVHVISVPTP